MEHLVPEKKDASTCQGISGSIITVEDLKYDKKDSNDKYSPTDACIVGFGAGNVSAEGADGFVIIHDGGVIMRQVVLIGWIWITEELSARVHPRACKSPDGDNGICDAIIAMTGPEHCAEPKVSHIEIVVHEGQLFAKAFEIYASAWFKITPR
jgi:hypothetical protein